MKNILLAARFFLLVITALILFQQASTQVGEKKIAQISYKAEQGKIYYSTDTSNIWKQTTTMPDEAKLVAWDSYRPERVIVIGTRAVWISTQAGRSWKPTSLSLSPRFEPTELSVSKINSGFVYLTGTMKADDGDKYKVAWRSNDGGNTWISIRDPETVLLRFDDSTLAGQHLNSGGDNKNFTQLNSGGDTVDGIVWMPPIQLSPDSIDVGMGGVAAQGDTIHITWWGSFKFPYLRSTNGGQSFEPLRELVPDTPGTVDGACLISAGKRLHGLYMNLSRPAQMYSMYSDDGGTTWSTPKWMQLDVPPWSYSAHGDTVVYLLNADGSRVVYTTDGGETWTKAASRIWGPAPYITFANGVVHLVKGTGYPNPGLPTFVVQYKRSTDLGNTWTDSLLLCTDGPGSDNACIAADRNNNSSIVVSVWRDGKYGCMTDVGCSQVGRVSFDNGTSWQPQRRFDVIPAGYDAVASVQDSLIAVSWNHDIPYAHGNLLISLSTNHGYSWTNPYTLTPDTSEIARSSGTIALSNGIIHRVYYNITGLNETARLRFFYRRGIILSAQRPRFSISTNSLFSDETTISCPKVMQLVVSNRGGLNTLNAQAEVSGDSSFSITPSSASIAHYDSMMFFVTFSPQNIGEKSADIIFTHNGSSSPDTVSVSGTATGTPATSVVSDYFNTGWQIISLPLNTLCPYTLNGLYAYESHYVLKDTMEIGTGYWKKLGTTTLRFVGYPVLEETVHVNPGWNIIGSINIPVMVSNIMSDPPGIMTSQFFGYNNGYDINDTIQPGKAYWVKVSQSGELILSSSSFLSRGDGRIHIVATSELPPPPPGGELPHPVSHFPNQFLLEQNYPNPFNPVTAIRYSLPAVERSVTSLYKVNLAIYDLLGRQVATLFDGEQNTGYFSVNWDAGVVPSGVYFCRLTARRVELPTEQFLETKKLLLLR